MPQVRFSTSMLGAHLAPKISSFLKDNIEIAKELKESSAENGAELISNAIAYGVSLALSSDMFRVAFSLGIAPPPVSPSTVTPGGPVGTLIYNSLKPNVIET